MKNHDVKDTYISWNDKRVIMTCIISVLVFTICFLLLYFGIAPPLNMRALRIFYAIAVIISLCSSAIFSIFTITIILVGFIGDSILLHLERKKEATARKFLSNTPKVVKIKNKETLAKYIAESDIICEARLDMFGNIHYTIKVDSESYANAFSFLNDFDIT